MKKFAVGFFNQYDNKLTIEIVEADNWQEATVNHSLPIWNCLPGQKVTEDRLEVPGTVEEAKHQAFNYDYAFDIVEVV